MPRFSRRSANASTGWSPVAGALSTDPSNRSSPVGGHLDSEKVIGNILALGGGEIVARGIAFIGIAYLARELGPTGFGIISFALALVTYLSFAVHAGFDEIGGRAVARRPGEAPAIAASVVLVRLVLAAATLGVLAVVALLVDKPSTVKLVIVLTGLSFFAMALDTAWVYKALERNLWAALALVIGQVLYVGTVVLVVRGPEDVTFVPLAQLFGEMSAALLLAVSLVRLGRIKLDLREGWTILRGSGFLTLSRLLRRLIFTFDVVLLGLLLGEREAGLYAAPYRFCLLFLVIAIAMQLSYLPVFARVSARGVRELGSLGTRSVELSFAIIVPVIAGGMIVAVPLIRMLFGPEYLEAGPAFRLQLLGVGFFFISSTVHNLLLVGDRLKVEMWIVGFAAALNVGLNLVLIPLYGLVGAASATASAEGLILLLGIAAVYRMGVRLDLRPVLRPLLAAGVMVAPLIALGPGRELGLHVAVGFVVYTLALVAFRGVPQEVRPHLSQLASYAGQLRERLGRTGS